MSGPWDSADRAKILSLAKELRSSAATKTAVFEGRNVSYIKGSKLTSFMEAKGMTSEDAKTVGNALLREDLVVKAELHDRQKKTLRSARSNPKSFEPDAFLVWKFEGSTGMRNFLLMAIVVAFFGLVLFPVWPQGAKVGVWYVSMTLLLVLLGFIFSRIIVFCLFYAIGIDFWILPNFFADDAGFWDSFKPMYSFDASVQNIRETWPYRLTAFLGLLFVTYWVVTQPTEFDEFVASQRAFVDELYEGTLLADKSQKDKEQIDKVVPDLATVQKELDELEKQYQEQQQQKEANVEKKMEELLEQDTKQSSENDEDDEIADL